MRDQRASHAHGAGGAPDGPGREPGRRRRRGRFAAPALAAILLLFLAYAIATLREHAVPEASSDGPLRVRTDRMRGQPCHVADEMIMGDCTPEEIAALQREARTRAPAASGR